MLKNKHAHCQRRKIVVRWFYYSSQKLLIKHQFFARAAVKRTHNKPQRKYFFLWFKVKYKRWIQSIFYLYEIFIKKLYSNHWLKVMDVTSEIGIEARRKSREFTTSNVYIYIILCNMHNSTGEWSFLALNKNTLGSTNVHFYVTIGGERSSKGRSFARLQTDQ